MLPAIILAALTISDIPPSIVTAETPSPTPRVPLLSLNEYPGYVHPDNVLVSTCTVYDDVVDLGIHSPDRHTNIALPVRITGNIGSIIAAAARQDIEHRIGPVDGPTKRYTAYFVDEQGATQEVDLGSWLDGDITENKSPAANHLRALLERLCHQL